MALTWNGAQIQNLRNLLMHRVGTAQSERFTECSMSHYDPNSRCFCVSRTIEPIAGRRSRAVDPLVR